LKRAIKKSIDIDYVANLGREKYATTILTTTESDIGIDEFYDRHAHLTKYNRKLTDIRNSESELVSIRRIDNDVIFLYRFGVVNAESDKPVSIYVPCIFDFENNLLHIKMRINYIKKSEYKAIDLITKINDEINAENDVDITISAYNPSALKKVLYNVFSKEAEDAESIIKSKIMTITDDELNLNVKTFLTDQLKIEASPSYVDRVKSTFYQSKSLDMNNEEFYGGFIFAFSFLDGAMTRSLTRSSDREPVFNKKIYWNLKDIIHEEKEITELSLYWKFDIDDFDVLPEGTEFSFVEISLRERKGMLEIHYYKCNGDRRKKNEYVIHRVIKYLREEGLSQ